MTFNKQQLIEVMKQNDVYDTLEFVESKIMTDCVDICSRSKHKNGDFIRLQRLSFRHGEQVLADRARQMSQVGRMVECAIAAADSNDVIKTDKSYVKIRLKNGAVLEFDFADKSGTYASSVRYDVDKILIAMYTSRVNDLLEATYQAAELIDNLERMIKCSVSNSSKVTGLVNERLKELNRHSGDESSYIGSVVKELADKYNKGDKS